MSCQSFWNLCRAAGSTGEGEGADLAVEVSPFGVRDVCLRTLANTDTRTIQGTMDALAGWMNVTKDQAIAQIANSNFLKTTASMSDLCSRLCRSR